MAKLSARGRTQFARVKKGDVKLALMSDRTVLVSYGGGRGWNVKGKLKKEVTPETWLANKLEQGWEQVAR